MSLSAVDRDRLAKVVELARAHAADVDASARFPVEAVDALREAGFFGLLVPAEYGGMGMGLDALVHTARRLGGACQSTAMVWAMHCQQADVLVRHARPTLREDVLPKVASGDVYLASVTTDATSGGSLATASAAINRLDDDLVIDRHAPIVTGGLHADAFLVTMRSGGDARPDEVTLVYVERGRVVAQQTAPWTAMGMRGTQSVAMHLHGSVPMDHVVGDVGRFRDIAADSMIPAGHLGWAACWLGAGEASLSALVRHLARRGAVGRDGASDLVLERLARTRSELELVSAYLARACDEITRRRAGGEPADDPSVQIHLNTLKLVASELVFRAVDRMVQMAGLSTGYSSRSPLPLERMFRDVRSAQLNFANDRLLVANGMLSMLDRRVTLLE